MNYDDHYARWSYEQLLLQQPHIEFGGLWRIGWRHFVICPQFQAARTIDGEDLAGWFHNKCRVITAPIEIVASCPLGAERVPERTAAERVALVGAPRTIRDVLVEMSLALSHDFPPFTIRFGNQKVTVATKESLTSEKIEQARSAYAMLGHYGDLNFETDAAWESEKEPFRISGAQGDLDLIPSRRLPSCFGYDLRALLEEDEDFWVDNRHLVLATPHNDPNTLLPEGWASSKKLSCFVEATAFLPENMRTYLSLYDTVHLALPINTTFRLGCQAMGVTPKELHKLMEMGRVKIILPQAIDRYLPDWLSEAAERAPQSLLLSRRLAAATIVDARRRIPFLYPPLSVAERYILLHVLLAKAKDIVGSEKEPQFVQSLKHLGAVWAQVEWAVQSRGAMGSTVAGVGGLAATLFEHFSGRDLRLEFWGVGNKVSWATALGSHVFPFKSEDQGYDESALCDFAAGMYSSSLKGKSNTAPPAILAAVADLLAIDNDVPVLDFAGEFSSATISRLREFVLGLVRNNSTPEAMEDAIRSFNADVRHYEKRADRLKRINLVGILAGIVGASGVLDPTMERIVPLVANVLSSIVGIVIEEVPRRYEGPGKIVDFLNSALAGQTNAGTVLVARTRSDVARLRK